MKFFQKIKPRLCANYKYFGYFDKWLKSIENRIDNITIDDLTGTIENAFNKLLLIINQNNVAINKRVDLEEDNRTNNDTFLQNQINTMSSKMNFLDNLQVIESSGISDFTTNGSISINFDKKGISNLNFFIISAEVVSSQGTLEVYSNDVLNNFKYTINDGSVLVEWGASTNITNGGSIRLVMTSIL